jgi:hypothetical protein
MLAMKVIREGTTGKSEWRRHVSLHRWPCWRCAGCRTWGVPSAWSCAPPPTWRQPVPCCRFACCWAMHTPLSTRHYTGFSTGSRSSSLVVLAHSIACSPENSGSSGYPTFTAMPPQLPLHQPMRPPSDLSTRDMSTSGNRNTSGTPPHTSCNRETWN